MEKKDYAAWLRAVELVLGPDHAKVRCPSNDDGDLELEWQEADEDGQQNGRLYCPSCGEYVSIEMS
jgi:hypothetical protein